MEDQFQWREGSGCQPLGWRRKGNGRHFSLQELSPEKLLLYNVIHVVPRTKTKYHLACKPVTFCQATWPFQNRSSNHTGLWMVFWRGWVPFRFCLHLLSGLSSWEPSVLGFKAYSDPTQPQWPCSLNPWPTALLSLLTRHPPLLCNRILLVLKFDLVAFAPKSFVAICGYRVRSKFWNMAFIIYSTLSYT